MLFLTVNFLLKKLKSFFCYFRIGSILIRHLMTTTKMELELSPVKRTIIVKKRRPVAAPAAAKTSIDMFDEYIQKSGLEPKSYQREGVEFCLRRESAASAATGITGGIIADEMGLGKTMMMMGLILANLAAFKRTLIVVPVALVAQWVAQIKRTIIDTGVKSDLVVFVFHGASAKRRVVCEQQGNDECPVWCHRPPKNAAVRAIDIVITTYGCVAMEEPAASTTTKKKAAAVAPVLSLLTFRANRVIFDEAHHLRNKKSRVFKGAMRLVVGRPSVWCVTGTPIQNKISDLKSLCYVLGFRMCDVMSEEKRKQIRNEYVLRRTKVSVGMVMAGAVDAGAVAGDCAAADVTCAPRLQSLEHYKSNVPWSSENELDLSREIHRSARNTTDHAERLKLYTRMRQMCVWPSLLRRGGDDDTADDNVRHGLSLDEYRVAVSKQSKMDRVVATMVAEAAAAAGAGRKSIVFCHFRREMTQLRDMLLRSSGGAAAVVGDGEVSIIDGTVSAKERARILAAEPTVLILQIRTCSEGLNLQSYSDVYFVSPHWNPCVEDQAIARCYRLGQTSQVRVFRFYMSDFAGGADAGGAGVDAGGAGAAGVGGVTTTGGVESECISTLDHKCEEIQERKRVLCNEFLCGV